MEKGVRESLQNLGLDYLNLYLIHFPVALKLSEVCSPTNNQSKDTKI